MNALLFNLQTSNVLFVVCDGAGRLVRRQDDNVLVFRLQYSMHTFQVRSQVLEPIVASDAKRTLELAVAIRVGKLRALVPTVVQKRRLLHVMALARRLSHRRRRRTASVRLQGRVACRSERRRGAGQFWFRIFVAQAIAIRRKTSQVNCE